VRRVTLLGPLADDVDLTAELAALGVDGPVALVTAGWEEGERNDAEIDRRLGGGTRNLGLYGRRLDVLGTDEEYAEAERVLRAQLDELRDVYLDRLAHALDGLDVVRRRAAEGGGESGVDSAIASIRDLDSAHATAIAQAYERFYAANPPHERAVITAHREEVAAIVDGCAAITIAGGHAGVLNDCLHLCNLTPLIEARPMLAWSSGCMAISERLVVVDDGDPAGRPDEVYDLGMGIARGMVALPASARLRSHDPDRLAVLARRCAPSVCVVLDPGDRLELTSGHPADLGSVTVIHPDGRMGRGATAA